MLNQINISMATIIEKLKLIGAYCVILPMRAFTPAMFFLVLTDYFFSLRGADRTLLISAVLLWAKIEIIFFIYSQITQWRLENTRCCLPIATGAMRRAELRKILAVAYHIYKGADGRDSTVEPLKPVQEDYSFVLRKRSSIRRVTVTGEIFQFSPKTEDTKTIRNRAFSMENLSRSHDENLLRLIQAHTSIEKLGVGLETVTEDDEKIGEENNDRPHVSDSEDEAESEPEKDAEDESDHPDPEFLAFKRADFCSWFVNVTPKDIGLIYRGNLEEWVKHHTLFPRPPLKLDGDDIRQVSELTDKLVAHLEIKPKRGYNPDVQSVDMMHDVPISVLHRPFLQYACVRVFIEAANFMWSKKAGFIHYKAGICSYYYRPPRVEEDPKGAKPGPQNKLMPLVFLHGLGFGPTAWYLSGFLQTILDGLQGDRRQIIVVSFPHMQMRPSWEVHCPTTDELVTTLTMILHAHKATGAHFIGHSFGTIIAGWFASRTNFVKAITLIDPVCVLSLDTNIIMKIITRGENENAQAKMLRYFAFQESTTVAVALKNQFPLHNAFDFEKVMIPCFFAFGGNDAFIPGMTIKRLIEYHKKIRDESPGLPKIEFSFEESYIHGSFLIHGKDILSKVQSVDDEAHRIIKASRERRKGRQPSVETMGRMTACSSTGRDSRETMALSTVRESRETVSSLRPSRLSTKSSGRDDEEDLESERVSLEREQSSMCPLLSSIL